MSATVDEYRQAAAKGMSEAELQQQVIACARSLGYLVAHFRPAMTAKGYRTPVEADGKGFPDLVLTGAKGRFSGEEGRLIFVELKSARGRLEPEQRQWIDRLVATRLVNTLLGWHEGFEVYVWRPKDWLDGTVQAVLSGERGTG